MAKISTEDFLAHYGVKGMKWGRRKAEGSSDGGSSSSAKPKKPSSADILEARKRHNARVMDIYDQDAKAAYASTPEARKKATAKLRKMAREARASEDAKIGNKATAADKVVSYMVFGPLGGVVVNASMKRQQKNVVDFLEKAMNVKDSDYKPIRG